MLDTITTQTGQAEPFAPDRPKEKARLTATPGEPHGNNSNVATVPTHGQDDKAFTDTCARFALLGYELTRHRTAAGLVHHLRDEADAPPTPSKAATRTTFIVGHWTGPRHLASWHAVIGLLTSLQDTARG